MTDQHSLSPPSSSPSAGQGTADERRHIEDEATLIAKLVLWALSICWLALAIHVFHIFGAD